MKPNMGSLDRLLRVLFAAALLVLAAVLGAGTIVGIVLLALAAIMLATASLAFCPLYRLLHIDTRQLRRDPAASSPSRR